MRVKMTPFSDSIHESFLAKERSQRKFFTISHNDISSAIRINLTGRERNGKVQLGAGYDECCEVLTKDLLGKEQKKRKVCNLENVE